MRFEGYLGLVALSVVLWYVFRNATETGNLVAQIADANTQGIAALQGRPSGSGGVSTRGRTS